MNRKEVISSIALRTGSSTDQVEGFLAAFEQVLLESVSRGEKVQLPGVLSVERVERAARTGRNPRTGEALDIAAGFGVKATPGSRLKAAAGA